MERKFNTASRGTQHGVPEKEADIAKLVALYVKSGIHVYEEGHWVKGGEKSRVPDCVTSGAINLESNSTIENWWNN